MQTHRPPSSCPVCSDSLVGLRLGCPTCGTEVSGHFETCRFCRLSGGDRAILEVFLRSRGNIRDVQAHLGVSYPTARVRLIDVLDRLGLAEDPAGEPERPPAVEDVGAVLADLAAGRIDVHQAERFLDGR